MNQEMRSALDFFVKETHIMTGLSLACGGADWQETALDGLAMERVSDAPAQREAPLRADTLFDLASLTKLFTALTIMALEQDGLLPLDTPVSALDDRFPGLSGLTVRDILCYQATLRTPQRVDQAQSPQEAQARLFQVQAVPHQGSRIYSDMHSLTLGYLAERAAGAPLYDYMKARLLDPLGMSETFAAVPEALYGRLSGCNHEHRIENGRYVHRRDVLPGCVNDPKAELLRQLDGRLCGHAGLFSTLPDMIRLCRGLLNETVLPLPVLREMTVNRTGHPLPEGGYRQYLGYLCFVRHPDQYLSEVPPDMSAASLAFSGFTGHHISLDFERRHFIVALGNRVQNRLSSCVPEKGGTLTDYGLNPDGTGRIAWPDGERVYSSAQYVHQRDEHMHAPLFQIIKAHENTPQL